MTATFEKPLRALTIAVPLAVAGIAVVAGADAVAAWVAGLAVAAAGIGLANTGSIGVLLAGIPADRSVTAVVVWSQVGIVGYLLGPLVGGPVVEAFGFPALGLVVVAAALPVLLLVQRNPRTA